MAIVRKERGAELLFDAVSDEVGFIPAPVIVEFHRVTSGEDNQVDPKAARLMDIILSGNVRIAPFDEQSANIAVAANALYGSGNHKGGLLNMLDLMVYGMAKARGLPILFTGHDFATTDALIHPASRIG